MTRLLLASSVSLLLLCSAVTAQEGERKPNPVRAANAAWDSQNWQAASAAYRVVVKEQPKNGQAWHRLGYSLHALGELDAAMKAHAQTLAFPQFAPTGAYNTACVHALRGNKDEAFKWLAKSVKLGMNNVQQFAGDADLDSLRGDERYAKIIEMVQASASKPRLQVFAQTTERKRNRIAWFGQNSSPGQLSIEYGAVPWQKKFAKMVGSEASMNRKWRLGADFWTSLDTSVAMQVAGVDVPAGYYYLTLEQREAGFVLALHDAAAVKKQKLDGFVAHRLKGGIEIPMQHQDDAESAAKLHIEVALTEGQDEGQWRIAFGPHLLTAKTKIDLGN